MASMDSRHLVVMMLLSLLPGGALQSAPPAITSRDGSRMVLAPAGPFVMGTGDGHKDENGRLFHGGY